MAIVLPHVFQDNVNETASGVQVNENLNVLKAAIEALEAINAATPAEYTFAEAVTSRALSTNFTPSSSRPAMVFLSMRANPTAARCQVSIDGTGLFGNGGLDLTAGQVVGASFIVKAGGVWQAVAASGPMDLLMSTYLLLPKT